MNPRKISHKVFEIHQKSHLWIEEHDGHYAVFIKSDLPGQTQPGLIAIHDSLMHARANLEALIVMYTPSIIEGSLLDVTEFDRNDR